MTTKFDKDEAAKALLAGQPITGVGGVLTPLIKQSPEAPLNVETGDYSQRSRRQQLRPEVIAKLIRS